MAATGAISNDAPRSDNIGGLMGHLRNSGQQLHDFTTGLFAEMRTTVLTQARELLSLQQVLDQREVQLELERVAHASDLKRLDELRDQVVKVEEEIAAKEELTDETRELLDDLVEQRDQLRRELGEAESQRGELVAEIEQLQRAVEQARSEAATLDAARVAAAIMPAQNKDAGVDALRRQVQQVQRDAARRRGEEEMGVLK